MIKRGKHAKYNLLILVIAILISYGSGFIGSLFTVGETESDWYNSIKPSITPPNWVFPAVWNVLFFLIALSFYFAWSNAKNKSQKIKLVWIYGANLIFNVLWSVLYFGMQQPLWAFIDIIIILCTIILAIIFSWKIDKRASWLLVPYLLWVTFASIINYLSI